MLTRLRIALYRNWYCSWRRKEDTLRMLAEIVILWHCCSKLINGWCVSLLMNCAPEFILLLSSFIIFSLIAPPVHNLKHSFREHSKDRGENCILKEILYADFWFLLKSIANLGTGLELLFVCWLFSYFLVIWIIFRKISFSTAPLEDWKSFD